MGCLVWTRSAEDLGQDRTVLPLTGDVIFLPCIRIRRFSSGEISAQLNEIPSPYKAVIFTSLKAAEIAVGHDGLRNLLRGQIPIFSLGQGTQGFLAKFAIKALSFSGCLKASDLAQRVLAELPTGDSSVLLPGGVDRAFDMQGFLLSHGHGASHLSLYETVSQVTDELGEPLAPELSPSLEVKILGGSVAFASPSAVRGFIRYFSGQSLLFSQIRVVCIGPTTALEAGRYFPQVEVAPRPDLRDLVLFACLDSRGTSCAVSPRTPPC